MRGHPHLCDSVLAVPCRPGLTVRDATMEMGFLVLVGRVGLWDGRGLLAELNCQGKMDIITRGLMVAMANRPECF